MEAEKSKRKPELRFETVEMKVSDLGEESCTPDLLGETILQNQLIFCLNEEDEIYEGYGRRKNAYPYRQRNGYSKDLRYAEVKTAVLENSFLKAVFLPEYGGRLWSLTDKRAGRELLYTNDVLRFRNLAVRNAWFSGGVEWNIGVIGHSPLTAEALYTAVLEAEDGAPVLRMYEFERVRQIYYQMDFWLEEDGDFLNCRMRVVNENSEVMPMYWWSNIAVPEFKGGRVIVPADKAFTFADGKVYKTAIPIVDGVDVTEYEKIPRSVDYFFDIDKAEPKYIANVDAGGYGLLQLSTGRLGSRKLFSWGHLEGSRHWQEFLTENAGNYVEIQAGLGKTQYGCVPMAPHSAWEWLERYGAVQVQPELMRSSHEKRRSELTDRIRKDKLCGQMEELLRQTKPMAKRAAKVVLNGSGYGALYAERKWSEHLEFQLGTESLQNWARFRETGILHEPSPEERPDEFFDDEWTFELLKRNICDKNKDNWYAHYHLGVCYLQRCEFEAARRECMASLRLADNAWALHALACCMLSEAKESGQAVDDILKGMNMRTRDAAYLKEGFKLLSLLKAYRETILFYERMEEELKSIRRLKFYYINSLYHTGMYRQALQLMEEDGGLIPEDMREGEISLGLLWSEIVKKLEGETKETPYRFDFKTY